jgi:hypothetical protein
MSITATALDVISSANLTPTEHLLLKGFVNGAVDPELAAIYLLSRVDSNEHHDVETKLREFKKNWRRLVTRRKILVCDMTCCDIGLNHYSDGLGSCSQAS